MTQGKVVLAFFMQGSRELCDEVMGVLRDSGIRVVRTRVAPDGVDVRWIARQRPDAILVCCSPDGEEQRALEAAEQRALEFQRLCAAVQVHRLVSLRDISVYTNPLFASVEAS